MAEARIEDLLVANKIVGREKLEAICRAARSARLTVAVDDARKAQSAEEFELVYPLRIEEMEIEPKPHGSNRRWHASGPKASASLVRA